MVSTVIPKEARAVYYSYGGANMKDRISKTAKLGYDIGTQNAYAPDGTMIITSVKTRIVHAAVRHLLPQSPHWNDAAPEEIPISQADTMVTWHSLATTVMRRFQPEEARLILVDYRRSLMDLPETEHRIGYGMQAAKTQEVLYPSIRKPFD